MLVKAIFIMFCSYYYAIIFISCNIKATKNINYSDLLNGSNIKIHNYNQLTIVIRQQNTLCLVVSIAVIFFLQPSKHKKFLITSSVCTIKKTLILSTHLSYLLYIKLHDTFYHFFNKVFLATEVVKDLGDGNFNGFVGLCNKSTFLIEKSALFGK